MTKFITLCILLGLLSGCSTTPGPETSLKVGSAQYFNNKDVSVDIEVIVPTAFQYGDITFPAGTVFKVKVMSDGAIAAKAKSDNDRLVQEQFSKTLGLLVKALNPVPSIPLLP